LVSDLAASPIGDRQRRLGHHSAPPALTEVVSILHARSASGLEESQLLADGRRRNNSNGERGFNLLVCVSLPTGCYDEV
jgi:hypothetical protein